MEEPRLPLILTPYEIIHLTDAISNKDVAEGLPDRDAYVPVAREALLLLGSIYKQIVTPDGKIQTEYAEIEGEQPGPLAVQFMVTLEQAWLFRSKVKTGDLGLDRQIIGGPLLAKIYDVICRFHLGINMDGWPDAIEPPENMVKLQAYREERARAAANANADPSPDPSTGS